MKHGDLCAEIYKKTSLSTANLNSGLAQFATWSADTVDDIDGGRIVGLFTGIAGKMRIATSDSIGRGAAYTSEMVSLATLETRPAFFRTWLAAIMVAATVGAAFVPSVVRRLC